MKSKSFIQRIVSIFFIALLMFSLSIPSYATGIQPRIDFVATMQIVSYSGGGTFSSLGYEGHSFLTFTNISTQNIIVGHMPVAPGDSITIGTFGNRSAHSGIWYNIEGYRGITSPSYGLVTGATASELVSINDAINNHDYWSIVNNCSSFARDVWNAGNSGRTVSGGNPAALANSIKSFSGYITNPTIPSKILDSIARHTSDSYEYDPSGA